MVAEDSGVAVRESGVVVRQGEAWMDRLHGAQRGSTVLVVCVMSCSAICDDHDVGLWFWSECIHPRDHRTYHDFSK